MKRLKTEYIIIFIDLRANGTSLSTHQDKSFNSIHIFIPFSGVSTSFYLAQLQWDKQREVYPCRLKLVYIFLFAHWSVVAHSTKLQPTSCKPGWLSLSCQSVNKLFTVAPVIHLHVVSWIFASSFVGTENKANLLVFIISEVCHSI